MPKEVKWAIALGIGVVLIWLGWKWTPLLVTLHVSVCLVLIVVIMLQSGSAADLAGAFGGAGSQTAFGPRGAATLLSRATTWCAIVFMMSSLTLSLKRAPNENQEINSILERTTKQATTPAPVKQVPPPSSPIQSPAPAPVPQPQTQTPAPKSQPPATQQPAPAAKQTPPPASQQKPAQNPPPKP